MIYASVCSGVEAATLAWEPLGWEPAWFSEIEPFPCEVLKQRWPNVPNLGDMTKIEVINQSDGQTFKGGDGTTVFIRGGVDLLVGGTPCQSWSISGKREGLRGASGLAKSFVDLLRAMHPRWFVWENVPGCLSARDKQSGVFDFNFLLSAFAECGYSLCWRIIDSQFTRVDGFPRAVPQRRRRVFVVGYLGSWEYPAGVLLESGALLGNRPPRRVKGKGFTEAVEGSTAQTSCSIGNGQAHGVISEEVCNTLNCMHDPEMVLCYENHGQDSRVKELKGGVCPGLNARAGTGGENLPLVYALAENTIARQPQNGGNGLGAQPELAYTQNCTGVMGVYDAVRVRKILPIEAERLMGFPDNHTRISWRGKPEEECPDSHRYKACGNSMAVNCMRWIGKRIQQVEEKINE